jgi:RNA polymerase sigma-70 factor (ECF subfamily)
VDEVTRLAVAAAANDRIALYRLVQATQAQVWRFCAYLAGKDQADDLTQEVYLRALRSLPTFRGESSAQTWLLAIARRVAADHHRRMARQRRLKVSAPAHRTGDVELHGELQAALDALDSDRRTTFVLTQVLGLSYAETAEVCGCPIGTVRSRVARARADLVAFLDDGEQQVGARH